jgi:drug/metabolite transporter (DMT)-like permease
MSAVHITLAMVVIAAVTVLGDYFLKLASEQASAIYNRWFLAGFIIYALCSFGWVFAMRYMKLATIGVVYSLSTILLLAVLGVVVFDETLNRYEILGIGFAVLSILLLARFGG